jgi:hypothetical protein
MTDRVADPEPGATFQPHGLDPLTLAAARDTGTPGFRIVATAPPESALPPVPAEKPVRREPWPLRVWSLVSLAVAILLSGAIIERLNPAFRSSDLPPVEWLTWMAFQTVIAIGLMALMAGLIPRAFQRAKVRRMRAEAARSGRR